MDKPPTLFGILNITPDSFSDGNRFFQPEAAIAHGRMLLADGAADVLDIGPASSNPDSAVVSAEEERRRLTPVLDAFAGMRDRISIDSHLPETHRLALAWGAAYLNDIRGFPEPALYPELARASCKLVVMHAVQHGPATRVAVTAADAWDRIGRFFSARIEALLAAGIARDRLVLDPGMGFFLSTIPETSLHVLAGVERLKRSFGLPVMVSVSRKSFLRKLVEREVGASGPASLAAELFASQAGADYIRTHDPAALRDGLRVTAALRQMATVGEPG